MARNAFATWIEVDSPWAVEQQILNSDLNLPLNVDGNPNPEAAALVKIARLRARQLADELPIIPDSGGPRRMVARNCASST
jgi:hypothetical protein